MMLATAIATTVNWLQLFNCDNNCSLPHQDLQFNSGAFLDSSYTPWVAAT